MLIDILNWYPRSVLDQHSINTYWTAVDSRPRLVLANSSIDRKLVDSRLTLDRDVDWVSTEVFIEWQLRCWLSVNWGFDGMYQLCWPPRFLCYGIKRLCLLLIYYGTPCAHSEKGQVSCGIFHGIIPRRSTAYLVYITAWCFGIYRYYTPFVAGLYFCHSLSHF